MIPHEGATQAAVALAREALALHEAAVTRALVGHVGAATVDALGEELDGPHVIAGDQNPRGLLQPLANQGEGQRGRGLAQIGAARLLLAVVRVKVEVAAGLAHAVARQAQEENGLAVGVYDVDQLSVGPVQAQVIGHALEIGLGGVKARDAAHDAVELLARVTGRVGPETVADQVDVARVQAVLLLQVFDQMGNFQTNEPRVGRGLGVQGQTTPGPIYHDDVVVAVLQKLVSHLLLWEGLVSLGDGLTKHFF